jgi:hypothetical protein
MTTGRRAFEAATQAGLVAKILSSEVPAVSTLAAGAPAPLDYLVRGCLAKEPADDTAAYVIDPLGPRRTTTQTSHA